MLRHMLMRSLRIAALVAGVVLTAGCGDQGSQIAQEPSPSTGGSSCEERSVDVPPDSAVSWANYLRFGDRVYTATVTGKRAEPALVPGERLGVVTCTRSDSRTPLNHLVRNGEAAYLETGTEFHSIVGRSTSEAITAVLNGERLVFTPDQVLTAQLAEAQRPASDVLDVQTEAALVELCKADTPVDPPHTNCKRLDAAAAARLAVALDGAASYGVGEPCRGTDAQVYKIVVGRSAASREFMVSTPCGPLTEGTRRYLVTDYLSRVLSHEHEEA